MASDAQLLYAWREGDIRAGEELFERYFPPIERFFTNKVNEDPSDLIQQTFKACVEGRDRIGEGAFRSYLFAIAYNVLRGHLRSCYRCREDELGSRSIHDIAPGPSTLLLESEQMCLLAMALRRIPLKLQVILELHYWEDMSSREIEQMLDINASTVRTHLAQGRRALVAAIRGLEASHELLDNTVENLDEWVAELRRLLHDSAPESESDEDFSDDEDEPDD